MAVDLDQDDKLTIAVFFITDQSTWITYEASQQTLTASPTSKQSTGLHRVKIELSDGVATVEYFAFFAVTKEST